MRQECPQNRGVHQQDGTSCRVVRASKDQFNNLVSERVAAPTAQLYVCVPLDSGGAVQKK